MSASRGCVRKKSLLYLRREKSLSDFSLVGEEGLEPSQLAPLVPKTSVSTIPPLAHLMLFYFNDRF